MGKTGAYKTYSYEMLPQVVAACKLHHQQASHLWRVEADLTRLPILPVTLDCHRFSLAPQ